MALQLLIGFLPWIVFYFLPLHTANQCTFSLSALLLLIIITGYRDLRHKFLLPWCTFIFFLSVFIAIVIFNLLWLRSYLGILSHSVLVILAFGSLAIGKPFTIQYARLQVAPDKWHNPVFIFISQVITFVWGMSFLVSLGINVWLKLYPDSPLWVRFLANAATLSAIIFTVWFPKRYRKKRIALS